MDDQSKATAVLSFDFQTSFPNKFWISGWSPADDDSDAFRYKIMSARHTDKEAIRLVIVLENANGTKDVLQDLLVRREGLERVVATFVTGLTDEYGLDFEEQDFSACRTPDDFDAAAIRFGWAGHEP